jgi:hypothetical protein
MRRFSILFTAALLTFLVVIVFYSTRYRFEARLFPVVIGIPAVVLLLVQIIRDVLHKEHGEGRLSGEGQEALSSSRTMSAYVWFGVWVVGFLLLIYVFGFLIAIPLFVFTYVKLHGRGWLYSLCVAVGMIMLIYGIFTLGMKMHFYPGLLFSWL